VINRDTGFVRRVEEFEFLDGAIETLQELQRRGYVLVVITNQSGIGRGIYSEDAFLALDDWMRTRFREEGAEITATYFCPHHPVDAVGPYRVECECRKPRPGMLLKAAADHRIPLDKSLLIGDRASDLEAARAAGIHVRLLVGTDGRSIPPHLADSELATGRYLSLAAAVSALARPCSLGASA
jgi:D-glycero-D-manno-heptose 1,7-bisphosphate phosphatase